MPYPEKPNYNRLLAYLGLPPIESREPGPIASHILTHNDEFVFTWAKRGHERTEWLLKIMTALGFEVPRIDSYPQDGRRFVLKPVYGDGKPSYLQDGRRFYVAHGIYRHAGAPMGKFYQAHGVYNVEAVARLLARVWGAREPGERKIEGGISWEEVGR